jgi:hypothetical protein
LACRKKKVPLYSLVCPQGIHESIIATGNEVFIFSRENGIMVSIAEMYTDLVLQGNSFIYCQGHIERHINREIAGVVSVRRLLKRYMAYRIYDAFELLKCKFCEYVPRSQFTNHESDSIFQTANGTTYACDGKGNFHIPSKTLPKDDFLARHIKDTKKIIGQSLPKQIKISFFFWESEGNNIVPVQGTFRRFLQLRMKSIYTNLSLSEQTEFEGFDDIDLGPMEPPIKEIYNFVISDPPVGSREAMKAFAKCLQILADTDLILLRINSAQATNTLNTFDFSKRGFEDLILNVPGVWIEALFYLQNSPKEQKNMAITFFNTILLRLTLIEQKLSASLKSVTASVQMQEQNGVLDPDPFRDGDFFCSDSSFRAIRFFPIQSDNQDHGGDCEKNYPNQNSKRTNNLQMFMCHHGFPVGASIARGGESTKRIAAQIHSYLPPSCGILYDFCCGLRAASKNLLPLETSKMRFILDTFHASNHKCSKFYSGKQYNEYSLTNTQVSEQLNSLISVLEKLTMNARLDTTMLLLISLLIKIAADKSKAMNL